MTRQWTPAKAYLHPVLAVEGSAGFAKDWVAEHGAPPKYLLIRPANGTGKTAVLSSFVRVGQDTDLVLTQKQLTSVGGAATAMGVDVEYRKAGFFARLWYTPDTVFAITVAALAWVATMAAGIFAYLRLVADTAGAHSGSGTTAGWVSTAAAVVLGTAALAATAKFAHDVRSARR